MFNITRCPTCGSRKIRAVTRDVTEQVAKKKYTVPGVNFHECPDCGERLYDREAMRRLEASSPARGTHRARRRISA